MSAIDPLRTFAPGVSWRHEEAAQAEDGGEAGVIAAAWFSGAVLFAGLGVWRGSRISGPPLQSPHFPGASLLLLIGVVLFFNGLAAAAKS
jgi:hypothetical protein